MSCLFSTYTWIHPGYHWWSFFFLLCCAQWCHCLCIVLSWLPLWFSVTFIYSVFIRSLLSYRLMDPWLIIFIPVQMKLLSPRVCGMPGPDRKHNMGKSENKCKKLNRNIMNFIKFCIDLGQIRIGPSTWVKSLTWTSMTF